MPGINIHGVNINNLRYADDTALITDSQENLQNIVSKVKEESGKAGLQMNVKKTKTMMISRAPAYANMDPSILCFIFKSYISLIV